MVYWKRRCLLLFLSLEIEFCVKPLKRKGLLSRIRMSTDLLSFCTFLPFLDIPKTPHTTLRFSLLRQALSLADF